VTNLNQESLNCRLLLPRWIATAVPGQALLESHGVFVRDGLICEVAAQDELRRRYPDVERIELADHLLIPGLVNLHTHAAMALLRGVGDDLPLQSWLHERIWPLERELVSETFVYDGSMLAAIEMLQAGITTVNDMYFFPDQGIEAMRAAGMRISAGLIVIDFPSAYANHGEDYLRKGMAIRDRWMNDTAVSFCLAPHAPYTVSDAVLEQVAVLSAELGLPVHMHVHETAREVEESLHLHGLRPLQRIAKFGLLGPDLIAVHGVHFNESDIAMMAGAAAHVAHCPHSNLKLASGFAPIAALLKAGVNVGIGTDGAASNNRLDLLAEAATAARLAKAVAGDASAFAAPQVLHALTLGGATALGLQDRIGSIELGKEADLVAVDLGGFTCSPCIDPLSHLVYVCGREQVSDVWVAGEPVVRMRQPMSTAFNEHRDRLRSRLPLWQNQVVSHLSRLNRQTVV
jgi:5-methylthioadenosine/S-adenosylhomocysteine deaminase